MEKKKNQNLLQCCTYLLFLAIIKAYTLTDQNILLYRCFLFAQRTARGIGNEDLIYHFIRATGIKDSLCGFLRHEKEVTMKTNSQLFITFTVAFSCFHFSNMHNYVGDENKITLVLSYSEKRSVFSCFQSNWKGRGIY